MLNSHSINKLHSTIIGSSLTQNTSKSTSHFHSSIQLHNNL